MELLEWFESKRKTENIDYAKRKRAGRLNALFVAGVCLVLLIAGISYTSLSRTVYFWDDATYWDMSRRVLSGALNGSFWRSVYHSVGSSDYNYVAALPSAAWMSIFGQSRTAYVAGLIIMYLIPSVLIVYRLAARLSKAPLFAFAAAVFMLPSTLFISASGFADVGGLLLLLCCYSLYFNDDSEAVWRYIAIGILLVLAMIFRRYFAFFSISFITAMAMDCILFRKSRRNLIITCITLAAVLFGAFMPFVTGILIKDYGTLYSGYKFPLATDIKFITRYFGYIFLLVMLAVPVISAIRKKEYRPVFAWIQLIVCGAMFTATQTHSIHHMLLYIPALMILAIFMINCVSRQWTLIAAAALTAANMLSPYIDRVQPRNIQEIEHLSAFPSFSLRPQRIDNIYDIVQAKRKLDEYIPEGCVCGVMASSFIVNDSILRNAEPSLNLKIKRTGDYIVSLPEVDSRDYGRLDEIYNSEYILVAFPAQTHLAPGAQTIVEEGVRSFANYADIALSFEQVEGYDEWIGDIELSLYHRKDNINAIWKTEFQKRLFKE